jgi:hypothetical protein
MASLLIKDKVLQEINLIPEDKLADLYPFIHYFRLGLEQSQPQQQKQTLSFAGSWQDMPDDLFADFTTEIATRRRQAFTGRRTYETGAD